MAQTDCKVAAAEKQRKTMQSRLFGGAKLADRERPGAAAERPGQDISDSGNSSFQSLKVAAVRGYNLGAV
jgi:hypothetical protein